MGFRSSPTNYSAIFCRCGVTRQCEIVNTSNKDFLHLEDFGSTWLAGWNAFLCSQRSLSQVRITDVQCDEVRFQARQADKNRDAQLSQERHGLHSAWIVHLFSESQRNAAWGIWESASSFCFHCSLPEDSFTPPHLTVISSIHRQCPHRHRTKII